jgi:hypothetical protein
LRLYVTSSVSSLRAPSSSQPTPATAASLNARERWNTTRFTSELYFSSLVLVSDSCLSSRPRGSTWKSTRMRRSVPMIQSTYCFTRLYTIGGCPRWRSSSSSSVVSWSPS